MKIMLEVVAILISLGGIVFAAGGFYLYMPRELARIREDLTRIEREAEDKGRERRATLDVKVDKNFETLDTKIVEKEKNLRADLSGIGHKVSRNHDAVIEIFRHTQRDAMRRYHNTTTAIMLAAPIAKENEVSRLLKEEASS